MKWSDRLIVYDISIEQFNIQMSVWVKILIVSKD